MYNLSLNWLMKQTIKIYQNITGKLKIVYVLIRTELILTSFFFHCKVLKMNPNCININIHF